MFCQKSLLWQVSLALVLHGMAHHFIELHKPLHHDKAVICEGDCIQYVSKSGQIWTARPSSGHRIGKCQSSSQFPRRVVLKNVLTIVLIKDIGFRKGRRIIDQIANIHWIIKKAREFQKNIYFCFIDDVKYFVWITTNCGKFCKRWEYQTTWPASWEICMQVKKQLSS